MTGAGILSRLTYESATAPSTRSFDGDTSADAVSAAVVIGIGGSGIQTITRVRSAIRADRPDQAAIDSITFLGIDAVDLRDQNPPLPPGVDLGTGEFFNLVESPFDASSYIRGRLHTDEFLQAWWDGGYRPPMGPLTEGLKRERMLGRLAFHRVEDDLVTRIQSAITRAVDIDRGHIGAGADAPDVPTIPIYIVNSASGGTGSSGFLPVVFAVWSAARSRGYHPEIRAVTYLPTVFRTAVLWTPSGRTAANAQDANAYAYFREVDHFCNHSSQLGKYLGRPVDAGGPVIPDGELLKQIYLVGSTMRGLGEITRIEDMYEIVAEVLYQFLLTEAGMPLVGVDATNTDRALAETDRFGKPRRYCSLGVARVVFPGDTYRRHLLARYVDWFVTEGLLHRPEELRSRVRGGDLLTSLEGALARIETDALGIEVEDEVFDFLDIAEQGKAELERTSEPATAQSLIAQVERQSPRVVRSIRDSASRQNENLLAEFDETLRMSAFASGCGVPFAQELLGLLSKRLAEMVSVADSEVNLKAAGEASAEARVHELMKDLQAAHNRSLYQQVAARLASVMGRQSSKEEIAGLLGQSIQSWAQAIHDGEVARARLDLLRAMATRLDTMRQELDGAARHLRDLAEEARRLWTDDTLIGKDAGPKSTTTVIPSDAQPEIEESALAKDLFGAFSTEHADVLCGDRLRDFITRWMTDNAHRGFFSVGSARDSEALAATRSLVEAIIDDAERRALRTKDGETRLPGSLPDAAADDHTTLTGAIEGLVTLSRSVCWSWEEGRFQLDPPEAGTRAVGVRPTVTTVIARHPDAAALLAEATDAETKLVDTPDPERIVALSVEWAVPIHALHDVDTWKAAYTLTERRRERPSGSSGQPPSHIDQRFAQELDPLVPEYFDRNDAALLMGQALIFGALLKRQDQRLLDAYNHSRANPAVAPFRIDANGRFQGRVIRVQDGRLQADATDTPLGSTWVDAIEAVGTNAVLRQSLEELGPWMVRRLGAQALLDEIDGYITQSLEPLIEVNQSSPAELEVLNLIFDALAAWQVQLKQVVHVG